MIIGLNFTFYGLVFVYLLAKLIKIVHRIYTVRKESSDGDDKMKLKDAIKEVYFE